MKDIAEKRSSHPLPTWRRKVAAWCRRQRLEHELREIRKFQMCLLEWHCPHLAGVQADLGEQIERQIAWMAKH